MISQEMREALNTQINEEMYSSYLYLQMAAGFASNNLPGFASWMNVQVQEETFHAMKLYNYIIERGGHVRLLAIAEPPAEWDSTLAAFEAALAHEQRISGCFDKLIALAKQQGDNATEIFLQWFVTEQVEEEAAADEIVQRIKLMGDAPGGIFMLDQQMAARTFQQPAAGE